MCSDTFKVWRDVECEFVANLRASQSRKNFENRLIFEERYGQDFSVFLFTVWKACSIYTVSAKHRSTHDLLCECLLYSSIRNGRVSATHLVPACIKRYYKLTRKKSRTW